MMRLKKKLCCRILTHLLQSLFQKDISTLCNFIYFFNKMFCYFLKFFFLVRNTFVQMGDFFSQLYKRNVFNVTDQTVYAFKEIWSWSQHCHISTYSIVNFYVHVLHYTACSTLDLVPYPLFNAIDKLFD